MTVRRALGELVSAGLVASDGFAGLRDDPARAPDGRGARPRRRFVGTLVAPPRSRGLATDREAAVELQAWALLRRYGVVFRRLLARETNAAPWRELARVYRRLEARGEIRGGRFVTGMSGEQFALADAVDRLREVRRTPLNGALIAISAADPLNLAGIVTPGDRVPARGAQPHGLSRRRADRGDGRGLRAAARGVRFLARGRSCDGARGEDECRRS